MRARARKTTRPPAAGTDHVRGNEIPACVCRDYGRRAGRVAGEGRKVLPAGRRLFSRTVPRDRRGEGARARGPVARGRVRSYVVTTARNPNSTPAGRGQPQAASRHRSAVLLPAYAEHRVVYTRYTVTARAACGRTSTRVVGTSRRADARENRKKFEK